MQLQSIREKQGRSAVKENRNTDFIQHQGTSVSDVINNRISILQNENEKMKKMLERWHTIFKLHSFRPEVFEYLDKFAK